MPTHRRKFSAEFKAKIVLEVLSGRSTIAALARRHQIKDKLIYEWRNEALEKLPLVFERKTAQPEAEAQIAELERLVGQLTIEKEALKKASQWLSRLSRAGGKS
jgi:transposase-like protein